MLAAMKLPAFKEGNCVPDCAPLSPASHPGQGLPTRQHSRHLAALKFSFCWPRGGITEYGGYFYKIQQVAGFGLFAALCA